MRIVNAVILCTVLLAACQQAAALSYEVCDSYGAEWVTDSPHLEGQYPFYSLIFTCNSGANIEGKMVDSCLANGTACGQPAADAYCQYIGFDGAVKGLFTTVLSDEPARAVSGEWCVNEGSYQSLGALNRTVFQALNSTTANAPRCQKLDSVTCFRSRQTLGKAFATIQAAESSVAKASSQQNAVLQAAAEASGAPAGSPNAAPRAGEEVTAVGGRRLKGWRLRGL